MQIGASSASVLSLLTRAEAAAETGVLADTAPAQTSTTPASIAEQANQQADATTGLAGAALSAASVTVAQTAPGTEPEDEDLTEADQADQEDGQDPVEAGDAESEAEDSTTAAATQSDQTEDEAEDPAARQQDPNAEGPDGLTDEERQVVRELERRDSEVRRHENAHAAVGGSLAGAPSYTYQRGPNGQLYAVGGEVNIDTGSIPGNPEATAEKLDQVQRAALAPSNPSPQDLRVAAEARAGAAQARSEARAEALEEAAAEREAQQEEGEAGTTDTAAVAQTDGATATAQGTPETVAAQSSTVQPAAAAETDTASRRTGTDPQEGLAQQDQRNPANPNLANNRQAEGEDTVQAGLAVAQDSDQIPASQTPLSQTIAGQEAANDIASSVQPLRTQGTDDTQPDAGKENSALAASTPSQDANTDGRSGLQQALFDQERQTRTLLGQRAFEDAIRIRDTVTENRTSIDPAQINQAQDASGDPTSTQESSNDDGDPATGSAEREATEIATSLISGQRGNETAAPQSLFA